MRISDWSSDVCSSDLRRRCTSRSTHAAATPHRRRQSATAHPRTDVRKPCSESAAWSVPHSRHPPKPYWKQKHQLSGSQLVQVGQPSEIPKGRSEEHTSELQSLMRISYAVFCLKQKIEERRRRTPLLA